MKIRLTNKFWALAVVGFFLVLNFVIANPFGFFVAVVAGLVFLLQRPSDFES